jgi:CheY-like chemotaxis protein
MHGAKRAATLTARLLAFSRQQPLDPKPIEINRVLSGLADLLQRTLIEKVEFETVSGAGLWRALADPAELENALINLAVNARDAMSEGGKLSIETENVYLSEEYVADISEPVQPGQYVMIAVGDTGEGMAPEIVERVFEPFFTTKPSGEGTGLGLSQVYGFVRQTRGHIRIYSEPGQGTTVKLYLPRATAEAEILVEEPVSKADGGSETILIVEDDDNLRAYTTSALIELGYGVLSAADARAALNLVQSSERLDLLFTDFVLGGGINGRELAQEASSRRPGIKVLFTTGYTRNAIVHHGRLDAGVDLISKPFGFEGLARKVRQVLDR